MRFAIVDDNRDDIQTLCDTIENWAKDDRRSCVCDRYDSAGAFLANWANQPYDVIFLDIYMPDTTGLELAKALRRHGYRGILVFLTSSDDHRADAFDVHAFDYLVKPVSKERVVRLLRESTHDLAANRPFFLMPIGKARTPVCYDDILYVTADKQYCLICVDQLYRCRMPFHVIADALSGDNRFLVINRGVLINIDAVLRVDGVTCVMNDGQVLPMNTKRAAALRETMLLYQFDRRVRRLSKQVCT